MSTRSLLWSPGARSLYCEFWKGGILTCIVTDPCTEAFMYARIHLGDDLLLRTPGQHHSTTDLWWEIGLTNTDVLVRAVRGGLLQTDPQERTQNPHCISGLLTAPDPALTNMARLRRKTREHSKPGPERKHSKHDTYRKQI
jgi:hypothetical protein